MARGTSPGWQVGFPKKEFLSWNLGLTGSVFGGGGMFQAEGTVYAYLRPWAGGDREGPGLGILAGPGSGEGVPGESLAGAL